MTAIVLLWIVSIANPTLLPGGRSAGGVGYERLCRECGGNIAVTAPGKDPSTAAAVLHGLRGAPRPLASPRGMV